MVMLKLMVVLVLVLMLLMINLVVLVNLLLLLQLALMILMSPSTITNNIIHSFINTVDFIILNITIRIIINLSWEAGARTLGCHPYGD